MHPSKTISILALLGALTGCYPPSQTQYSPTVVEQPQPVHFFYGTLIAPPRQVSFKYGNTAGFGAALFATSPYAAGVVGSGRGGTAGFGAAAAGYELLAAGTVPELPATEYTVMPDYGTSPPDPYVRVPGAAAVIVVQNVHEGDAPMGVGQHVVVRVVGKSGRVMANPLLPQFAAQLAAGPLPIPLPSPYDGDPPPTLAVAPPLPAYLPSCDTSCNPTDVGVDRF